MGLPIFAEHQYFGSMIGGSIAGVVCWTLPYPIDCIKTQIQADRTYKLNMRSFLKPRMQTGLWRGFLPCILRSALVNPFIFLTYEYSKKYMTNS
jgi:hypothetical protein